MKQELKNIVKKMLGRNVYIAHSEFRDEYRNDAIDNLLLKNKDLVNPKNYLQKRLDNEDFYKPIKDMEPSYNYYAVDVYDYQKPGVLPIGEYDGLHSGTPMRTKPFKPCVRGIKRATRMKNLYWYPSCTGSLDAKQDIINYLVREGFNKDNLGVENISFCCSTTHGYSLILKSIARDKDVILVSGPNYGLFSIITELTNAHLEVLDLREEDDWYVNPSLLEKKIDEINSDLKKKYEGKLDYQPKVVAFLNINPHNPTGKVMNKNNIELLEQIGDVCLNKGVFIIDDLIYRELTFDMDNMALPIASMPKYFYNTISLFGLSKAFGLAGIRAGFIVAPQPVIRAIANEIAHTMDSIPVLQVEAVRSAFNGSDRRYKELKKYREPIIKEYMYRYNLLKAMVEGIDSIKDNSVKRKIYSDINNFFKDSCKTDELLKGLDNVNIKNGTEPDSGFFAILDFTKLKGKKKDNYIINCDKDLLKYFYENADIRFIMGSNMCWPNQDEIIGRVSFCLDKDALINNFSLMHDLLKELK